ncbi:MAG TPA: PVC-type heme-binding CxxCH protein [Pedobacter sp.]|jgi:putative heme-binding domain-containing protein
MKSIYKPILFLFAFIALSQSCINSKKAVNTPPSPGITTTGQFEPVDQALYGEHVRTTEHKTPEEERLSFVLPPGFEATLFASEPDITKPINMAFDEKGRLWVTQSSEYPVAAGPSGGNDRITILEDTNGDGRADKINDFVHDLNIPIGIMPVKGGAIGYSIPNVYRFYDTDNDGKADKREILLSGFGYEDTHGMVNNLSRGNDGWIHALHGYANTSVTAGRDGDSIRMYSGNTFRFRLDGSRVEKTTDGRINPFGATFDEYGYQYSSDSHSMPIYQLIWGGNYTQWGKRDPSMGFAPTMMDYQLNSTGLAGQVYYTDTHFPERYRNSFFSGDVVTSRISRNTIVREGTTPKATRQEDFLISRDPWFRPVDMKVGPDGALYIADFYNRIIAHYEIPLNHPGRDRISGRIWKITYKGNPLNKGTDWSKASLDDLLSGMKHEVPATRMRTTDELVDRFGENAIKPLQKIAHRSKTDPKQLVQVLWALYRLNALSDDVLLSAFHHSDILVQVHAFKIAANYTKLNERLLSSTRQALKNKNPHVQRAAAEALGRHPDGKAFTPLVELINEVPEYDTHLRYTAQLALKNHLLLPAVMQQAVAGNWSTQAANIIAVVAADVPAVPAATFLSNYLQTQPAPPARQLVYSQTVARYLPESEIPSFILFAQEKMGSDADHQLRLIKAITTGLDQRGQKTPAALKEWSISLATRFIKNMPVKEVDWTWEVQSQYKYAAEVAGRYQVAALGPLLKNLLTSRFDSKIDNARAVVASSLISISAPQYTDVVAKVLNDADETPWTRQQAALALGQVSTPAIRQLLGQSLKGAPYEVQITIASLLVKSIEGKTELLKRIRLGSIPARILKDRSVEEFFLTNSLPKQKQEYAELTAQIQPISFERQQLVEERIKTFDAQGKTPLIGQAIFTKNCGGCHQIDNKGGQIGPQLDGIGNWGRNALTTKILDPNRNISEAFRTYNITLKDGKTLSGLYRREEGQLLVFANIGGQEFTVSKADIKEKTASSFTLMPDHFGDVIKKEDFDALLVYLLNEK